MRSIFFSFLNSFELNQNKELIESIKKGYDLIFESIILTPVPRARITGLSDESYTEPISERWNTKSNTDNEYFDQTLPDNVLKITNNSYIGKRIGTYPNPPRVHTKADGDNHLSGVWGNSNGDYAGDSYGYNLGGPTESG